MTTDWERDWPAPAKLNLFLHVVGRRADGYHLLQTVFRFIDLADTLRFEPRHDGRVVLATPTPGVPDEQNLVVRAARALQNYLPEARPEPPVPGGRGRGMAAPKVGVGGTAPGVTIRLAKRIPQGGGLGGGSSDAATTLVALNHLWQLGLLRAELERIGLGLGADVPVFIHGTNCFAEGVGEGFTDLDIPQQVYLLTFPAVAVPTPEIFSAPELRRDTPPITPSGWHPGFGRNDLEAVACVRYPEVARHLEVLRSFGDARMTGSGACCFVTFPDEAVAEAARAALPSGMAGRCARGLAGHPLRALT